MAGKTISPEAGFRQHPRIMMIEKVVGSPIWSKGTFVVKNMKLTGAVESADMNDAGRHQEDVT